jgi:hypothetical protein
VKLGWSWGKITDGVSRKRVKGGERRRKNRNGIEVSVRNGKKHMM